MHTSKVRGCVVVGTVLLLVRHAFAVGERYVGLLTCCLCISRLCDKLYDGRDDVTRVRRATLECDHRKVGRA
jgi:hypothetical protein